MENIVLNAAGYKVCLPDAPRNLSRAPFSRLHGEMAEFFLFGF